MAKFKIPTVQHFCGCEDYRDGSELHCMKDQPHCLRPRPQPPEGWDPIEERLAAAVVVLRDRVFQSATFANSIAQDEPDTQHESAFDCLSRNIAAIKATDAIDSTDRSHEKWELEAEGRLAALYSS